MKFGIREIIFVVIMLGLLGSANYLVFSKSNQRKVALQSDMRGKQTKLLNLKEATAGIDDLDHKIDELQKAITFFESKLPREKEIQDILKEVSQKSNQHSLATKTVKTLPSEKGANYSEQPIQLTLSGNFEGFYEFLLELEKLPRITRITQMNLQKNPEHDGEAQAMITLSIFFDPDRAISAPAVASTNSN
jgi:Tfp pilus assembly protein PilO